MTEIPNRHPSPDRSQMRSTNRQAETAWKLRGSRTLLAPGTHAGAPFSEACHFFLLPCGVTPCNAGSRGLKLEVREGTAERSHLISSHACSEQRPLSILPESLSTHPLDPPPYPCGGHFGGRSRGSCRGTFMCLVAPLGGLLPWPGPRDSNKRAMQLRLYRWTDRAQVRKQAPSGSFHHLLLPASSFACELASMLSAVRAREPTSAGVSLNGKFPIARPWTGLSGSRFDASTPFVAMHTPQQIGQVQRPEIPTSRSSRSAKSCTSWMPHRTGAGLGAFAWSVKLVGHGASRKGGEKNDRTAACW